MPYGIITNCIAVFLGGVLGAFLKNHFPQKLKEALPNIFGLSAITMGISLLDCIDSDLQQVNRKIYDKITTKAKDLVAALVERQALKREDVGELRAMFDALWEEKGGGET